MLETTDNKIVETLEPICPRDFHRMSYEARGIAWKVSPKGHRETLPSYHCGYESCTVRYQPAKGYFTVELAPDLPYFIDEPGANLYQCPRHGAWLYRSERCEEKDRYCWRCGVEGCDYVREDRVRT